MFGASSTTSNFIASASRDGFCRIHDARRPGAPVMTTVSPENRGFTALDLSPDGRWLYAAAAAKDWHVIDAYTGHTVQRVSGHADAVTSLRCTSDGRVCTGSDDQELLVWNVARPFFW